MERLTVKHWKSLGEYDGCCLYANCANDSHAFKQCSGFYPEVYRRLARYEDAEEAGRLIELPCKVGDTVWFIRPLERKPKIEEAIVEKIGIRKRGMYLKLSCNSMYETAASSIGKSVFLSREEAERALTAQAEEAPCGDACEIKTPTHD